MIKQDRDRIERLYKQQCMTLTMSISDFMELQRQFDKNKEDEEQKVKMSNRTDLVSNSYDKVKERCLSRI